MARGISYVQLLLVIALLAILAGISAPYLLSWQQRERVRTTATMLWADLHYAQSKAMQLELGEPWGIHIDDASKEYVLFSGTTYNPTDSNNEPIAYANSVSITPSTDLVFAGLTGEPITGTDTTLTVAATSGVATITITINAAGLIEQ